MRGRGEEGRGCVSEEGGEECVRSSCTTDVGVGE